MGVPIGAQEYLKDLWERIEQEDARLTEEFGPRLREPLPELPVMLPRGPSEYGNVANG